MDQFQMKKNKFKVAPYAIVLLILILVNISSYAQNILQGTIKNAKDNTPVVGANIKLNDTFNSTTTDVAGHFIFKSLKDKNYTASVSHLSFETKTISLNSTAENNFNLDAKIYLAEEVTINASRVDKNSGAAFNNISKEDLAKNNLGQDLPILLENLPSVVVTSDAGTGVGYTGIRVRGNDASRVNVTINGIPVNDAEAHLVYWVDLPDIAASTDNIQFQRGLGSSTNGAGAFGASLNLQTTKITQNPYGSVSSSFGSFNTNKNSVSFGTGVLNNHFTIDGRMSMINSDGYIDRATSALRSMYLSGGYYDSKQFLRAVIITGKEKTYQAWYGVTQDSINTNRTYNPAGEYSDSNGNKHYYDNQTDNYQQDYYQLFYSRTINSSLTANVGLHYTRGKGYYEEFKPASKFIDYGLPNFDLNGATIDSADITRRKWLSNDFYGSTFSLDYSKNAWDIKLGGAENKYVGQHYNEVIAASILPTGTYPFRYYDDTANKTDVNFYLKTVYKVSSKLSATIDLQQRMINYTYSKLPENGAANAKLNFFNPRVGLSYQLNSKNDFYFYVGQGHKEPVRDDYLASTLSTRPQSEKMIDYEAGYSYENAKLILSFNGYYMNYQNQLILTGKINDVGEYIRESVPNSYRAGIETQVMFQLTKDLRLSANMTVSQNKIKTYTEYVVDFYTWEQHPITYSNTDISFSPKIISAAAVNYKLLKNINLAVTTKYVGKQYLDNTTSDLRKLDSYFVTNFRGSYSVPIKGLRSLELTLMLNNIFSEVYSANGYSYSDYNSGNRIGYNFYYPQATLNWLAGVTIKF